MNTKNNRRSQESCVRIKHSLLEMLERRDILDITVSSLCTAAGINRSTFYSHYDSVADVMEELEHEIAANLFDRFSVDNYDEKNPFSLEHFSLVLEHMQENQKFYRAFLIQSTSQSKIDWGFGELFKHYVQPIMRRMSVDDIAISYYFSFFKGGFVAILRHWLENHCQEPPEVILSYLRNVLSHPDFII